MMQSDSGASAQACPFQAESNRRKRNLSLFTWVCLPVRMLMYSAMVVLIYSTPDIGKWVGVSIFAVMISGMAYNHFMDKNGKFGSRPYWNRPFLIAVYAMACFAAYFQEPYILAGLLIFELLYGIAVVYRRAFAQVPCSPPS